MDNREIPRDQWRQELDKFSREHEGDRVRVEVTSPGGQSHTEANNLPLQGISIDAPNSRAVAIMVGEKADDHITHEIPDPVGISLEERAVKIRTGDGSTVNVKMTND